MQVKIEDVSQAARSVRDSLSLLLLGVSFDPSREEEEEEEEAGDSSTLQVKLA